MAVAADVAVIGQARGAVAALVYMVAVEDSVRAMADALEPQLVEETVDFVEIHLLGQAVVVVAVAVAVAVDLAMVETVDLLVLRIADCSWAVQTIGLVVVVAEETVTQANCLILEHQRQAAPDTVVVEGYLIDYGAGSGLTMAEAHWLRLQTVFVAPVSVVVVVQGVLAVHLLRFVVDLELNIDDKNQQTLSRLDKCKDNSTNEKYKPIHVYLTFELNLIFSQL